MNDLQTRDESNERGGPKQTVRPPCWDPFPIEATAEQDCSRRRFVQNVTIASGALAVVQGGMFMVPEEERRSGVVDATNLDSTEPSADAMRMDTVVLPARWDEIPDGGAVLFDFPTSKQPAILIRLDEARYVAYQQKCTHLACPVIPRVDLQRLVCPCHHGAFDLVSGQPVAGPPRTPLRRIRIERSEDQSLRAVGWES